MYIPIIGIYIYIHIYHVMVYMYMCIWDPYIPSKEEYDGYILDWTPYDGIS